jgi:signal transduction histidine kinase
MTIKMFLYLDLHEYMLNVKSEINALLSERFQETERLLSSILEEVRTLASQNRTVSDVLRRYGEEFEKTVATLHLPVETGEKLEWLDSVLKEDTMAVSCVIFYCNLY